MKKLILTVTLLSALIGALDVGLLPISLDTSMNATQANLAELMFRNSSRKIERGIERTYDQLDVDGDGVISAADFQLHRISIENQNGTNPELYEAFNKMMQEQSLDGNADGNITLAEFSDITMNALTRNFTLYPGICVDVAIRLDLCNVNVTEFLKPWSLEEVKCRSGLSGFENDFAFQKCVLGVPCNRVHQCFEESFEGAIAADMVAASSKKIETMIAPLVNEVGPGATFHSTAQQIGTTAAAGGATAALMTLLTGIVVQTLKAQLVPLVQQAVSAAVSSGVAWLSGLNPATLLIVGAVIVTGVLLWALARPLIDMISDMWWPSAANHLLMEKWDAYGGELEPKCEWSVYMEKKCVGKMALAKDYWGVCPYGGEAYRDRECASDQWKYFYQQYCLINRCRHMCLKTNFECGDDGFRYMNSTQWLTSPSRDMNPFMFNPSYANKQYALLDMRYVYQMSQCRDTCARYTREVTNKPGYTGCVGFILRSPDPMLDKRPAFQNRQVCLMLGVNEKAGDFENSDWINRDLKAIDFPYDIRNADDLFGYHVMRRNDYPPLIIALKN